MKTSLYKALYSSLVAGLLLATASTARGELKKFAFQGTLETVESYSTVLDSSLTNGAPFEGYYIFETTAPDLSAGDPTVGQYSAGTNGALAIKMGNQLFRSDPAHDFSLWVEDRDQDAYGFLSFYNISVPPLPVAFIQWTVVDPSGSVFTNDALPTTPPDPALSVSYGLTIQDGCLGYFIRGHITSLQEVPVLPDLPVTTIGKAVEVKWTSVLGYFYQVQRRVKHDPTAQWTDIGAPVIGIGGEQSEFFPKGDGEVEYNYRVVLVN